MYLRTRKFALHFESNPPLGPALGFKKVDFSTLQDWVFMHYLHYQRASALSGSSCYIFPADHAVSMLLMMQISYVTVIQRVVVMLSGVTKGAGRRTSPGDTIRGV